MTIPEMQLHIEELTAELEEANAKLYAVNFVLSHDVVIRAPEDDEELEYEDDPASVTH